jgi:hypothetical protein
MNLIFIHNEVYSIIDMKQRLLKPSPWYNMCNSYPRKQLLFFIWRVWRYQRGNQNPSIEEGQTIQWPKEKEQNDKQWSTKHYAEN